MIKPTGALELNPAHILSGNIVALVIMESDGNVRELVTDLSLGIKTTATLDGELALAEPVTGVNLGVDFSDFLSNLSAGDGSFSWGVLAKLPITWGPTTRWSRYGRDDLPASSGGSYSTSFCEPNTQVLRLYGGWTGSGPTSSGNYFRTDGTSQLAGISTLKSGGVWSTRFYKDGIEQGSPSTAALNAADSPNAGATHYFNVSGTAVSPSIYHVIFDKDLSSAEWAGITADPYGLVQAAGGVINNTEQSCAIEFLGEKTKASGLPVATARRLDDMASCPADHLLELSRSDLLAVEGQLKQVLTHNLVNEILGGAATIKSMAVVTGRMISLDRAMPVSWSGAVVAEFTDVLPVSFAARIRRDHSPAPEYSSGLIVGHNMAAEMKSDQQRGHILPAAWSGAVAVEFVHDVPVSWAREFEDTKFMPAEHMALIISDTPLPASTIAEIAGQKNIAAEFIMNARASHIMPVDWQGADGFITGISNIFKNFGGKGVKFAGRGRSTIFPKRKG